MFPIGAFWGAMAGAAARRRRQADEAERLRREPQPFGTGRLALEHVTVEVAGPALEKVDVEAVEKLMEQMRGKATGI